jgi:hypothetical protein
MGKPRGSVCRPLVRRFLPDAVALVAIGLLAIGASGVLAAGAEPLVTDSSPVICPGSRTPRHDVQTGEYAPGATSCVRPLLRTNTTEVIWYRIAAGIGVHFGLLVAMAATRWYQQRLLRDRRRNVRLGAAAPARSPSTFYPGPWPSRRWPGRPQRLRGHGRHPFRRSLENSLRPLAC